MIAVSVKPCIVMCILPDAGAISTSAEFLFQTLGRADLVEVMAAAKIQIKPLINLSEDADSYTSFHENELKHFFAMFT